METIQIYQTTKWTNYLLQQSTVLTVRQQIVLDLLMSVFFLRNTIAPEDRAKVIASKDYSFLKFHLTVDLACIAKIVYPKGSVKRPWQARPRWIKRFVEEAQGLCETNDLLESLELNGTVLTFRLRYSLVRPFYEIKMPSPLRIPVVLYRFPDSRVSPNAFIVNRALIRDRKMNHKNTSSYGLKLRSLLYFIGLQRPSDWKKSNDPWVEGPSKWFHEYIKRAIEGYGLFTVAMDIPKNISTEHMLYITPKYEAS